MDDLNDIVRQMLRQMSGDSTDSSKPSRDDDDDAEESPRVYQPYHLLQPSPATAQQPDMNGLSDRSDAVVPLAPDACAGAGPSAASAPKGASAPSTSTFPYPSDEPYRVMVEEPVSRKSDVEPVPSTSRASSGIKTVSGQASRGPGVKLSEQADHCRSEVFTPVASTSASGAGAGCAGAGSEEHDSNEPYLVMYEHPEPRWRFRYNSEIPSAGAIRGVNYTDEHKSYPKIKIGNYEGPVVIRVSLVCKDEPHRVHPHGIVCKKKSTKKDFTYIYVKTEEVTREKCVIQFDCLGIRYVKLDHVEEALQLRQAQGVDPFNQGFEFSPANDGMHAVRLCFEVKLGSQQRVLGPLVSNIITNYKKLSCLVIKRMCDCRGKRSGGAEIIILSRELYPKDLEVVFYEEENGKLVWEEVVLPIEAYERSAIVCTVPAYTRVDIQCYTEVTVNVALRRRSDGTRGDPRPFTYIEDDTDICIRKKRKMISDVIQQYVEQNWTPTASLNPEAVPQHDEELDMILNSLNSNLPTAGPSFVNQSELGPNSVNSNVAGLCNLEPNSANPVMTVPNALPGPSSVNPVVSGPNQVIVDPGLNSMNPFLPGLSQSQSIQTNIYMPPEVVPSTSQYMSISEDEDDEFI